MATKVSKENALIRERLEEAIREKPSSLKERAVKRAREVGKKPFSAFYTLEVSNDLVKRVQIALSCLTEVEGKGRWRDQLVAAHNLPKKVFKVEGYELHHSTHAVLDGMEEVWIVYAKEAVSFLWAVYIRCGKNGWEVQLCPQAELTEPDLDEADRGQLKIVLNARGEVVR